MGSILVHHLDSLLFNESKTTVIADGDRFHIVDIGHVSSLSDKREVAGKEQSA
jgi:hypothetical protein